MAYSSNSELRIVPILIISLMILNMLASSTAEYGSSCPIGWQAWGGACYVNILKPRLNTQPEAKIICKSFGAKLATPNSKAELDFIWELFLGSFSDRNPLEGFWIHCTDTKQEGVWVCKGDDNSGAPYRPPFHNTPNTDSTDCLVLSTEQNLHPWSCDETRNVMCELQALPTSQPSSCFAVSTGRCLHDHTLDVMTTERPPQCCRACNASPGCRSFNLIGKQCQLSNATRFQVDRSEYFKDTDNCTYYEL